MSLKIRQSTQFRRDVKRLKRQGKALLALTEVIELLASGGSLAESYRDHKLIGNWKDFRECHIKPDWLLVYRIEDDELQLARTGRHEELFH